MDKHKTIYLLTGSNLGEKWVNIQKAKALIELYIGPVLKESAIYQTEAWGKTDQASFLNQALKIATLLDPKSLLQKILEIENQIGRVRKIKWGARIIDIDILFYENNIINYPDLSIPHPQLQLRNFVLVPLMEIAPTFVHPVLNKNIAQLLEQSTDKLKVFEAVNDRLARH